MNRMDIEYFYHARDERDQCEACHESFKAGELVARMRNGPHYHDACLITTADFDDDGN
jgi:hypothetical protein